MVKLTDTEHVIFYGVILAALFGVHYELDGRLFTLALMWAFIVATAALLVTDTLNRWRKWRTEEEGEVPLATDHWQRQVEAVDVICTEYGIPHTEEGNPLSAEDRVRLLITKVRNQPRPKAKRKTRTK